MLSNAIYFPLLNSISAEHPSSLCLQYLQANDPRIKPFPIVVNIKSNTNADNRRRSNLVIRRVTPMSKGIKDIKISGIIFFHVKSLTQNFEISPFLKNHELSLPFQIHRFCPSSSSWCNDSL
jgi:hypothetical protein